MFVLYHKDSERRVENKTSALVFYPEPHPIFAVYRKYINKRARNTKLAPVFFTVTMRNS